MNAFVIYNREGVTLGGSDCLTEALELARGIKFSNELSGPSDIIVVDTRGLVLPINIP
jgi:hypothetical protein